MQWYEIATAMKYQHLKAKEQWEIGRMTAVTTATSMGAKLNSYTDFMQFPWEQHNEENNHQLTQADRTRIKGLAEYGKRLSIQNQGERQLL
jgi:hypothetical protein